MADRDYTELYASLQKETTILTAQIRALYRELDKKYHLRGAQIPITFGFETDALGLIQEPVTMKKNISIFRCFLLDTE